MAGKVFIGVDIGGTKIQASLISETGKVLEAEREKTPRNGGPEAVCQTLEHVIDSLLKSSQFDLRDVTALGVGVPGVVNPKTGEVIVTPNMSLAPFPLGQWLRDRFRIPAVVGNDCNLGTFGECWLGAGRGSRSAFGIFVGTGIGGGFVAKGKIWYGARMAAAEVGHIVMQMGGPLCNCGNRGCLEALASRTAIERQLREAVAAGRGTVLTEWLTETDQLIRSSLLRDALEADDALVKETLEKAAEVIGHACLTIRHLFDPEVIILGGGVMEACGHFMLPIIQQVVADDKLPGAFRAGKLVASLLQDNAVVLGAAALAGRVARLKNFKRRAFRPANYPVLAAVKFGMISIGDRTYTSDVYIFPDGRVKKRKKGLARKTTGSSHLIGVEEIMQVCKWAPDVLFVGTGHASCARLTPEANEWLARMQVEVRPIATPDLPVAFNQCEGRKAAIIHVTC